MRFIASVSSLTFLLTVACSPQPEVDLDAERTSLMAADRAWFEAYSASDSPADVFVGEMADNAYLLPPDAPLAQTADAALEERDVL